MRISTLIRLLEDVKHKHGDVHVRAYNSRGDDGVPEIRDFTVFKSGNKNPTKKWVVTTELTEP